jgi:hypothetical protein
MFLHKLDILNRNLNGLLQKFLHVVDEIMLCAVTKLGDLTVYAGMESSRGVEWKREFGFAVVQSFGEVIRRDGIIKVSRIEQGTRFFILAVVI